MRTPQQQHYLDMAMVAALSIQPQVSADLILLGYEYNGLKLDLYGERPRMAGDEYIVTDAALAGTTVSLFEILSAAQLRDFSVYCEENLESGADIAAQARCDARYNDEPLGVGA